MKKCPYFIRITRCGLDAECEPKCGGSCDNCTIKGMPAILENGERFPTIEQVMNVFIYSLQKKTTMQNVVNGVNAVMRVLGVDPSDDFRAIASQKALEEFLTRAHETMSDATAIMRVNAIRSLCSKKMRAALAENKFRVEELKTSGIPSKVRGGKYKKIPDEVRLQLVSLYDDLRVNDPALWLIMVGAWHEGKRMTDIMHTSWANFIVDGTRVTDVFTPHKTRDSSREIVSFPIDPVTWMRLTKVRAIMPEREGEFWFKGHAAETAEEWTLGKRFNKVLREKIPYFRSTVKAAHELRKARSQELIDAYGIENAAKLLGDNPQTLRKFYYDRHHVDFVPASVAN